MGYPSIPSALKVKEQGIEFMTPVNRARLADEVVGRDRFQFNAEGLVTACPMGHTPIDHRILSAHNTTERSLHAIFDGNTCRSCTMLDRCPGTIVPRVVSPVKLPVTSAWRSHPSFGSGMTCMSSRKPSGGRTGTGYVQA
jgi:hypothetical protein